jgi:uncharacterized protein YeaO (DUF488 family)
MSIAIKRAYDKPTTSDGARILVDRLWPRGVTKEKLKTEEWMKEIAPSAGLRKWYGHEVGKWPAFRERYRAELGRAPAAARVEELAKRARKDTVTLVAGARDLEHSNAAVIAELVRERM